jgi:hypothetical protein
MRVCLGTESCRPRESSELLSVAKELDTLDSFAQCG